MKHIGSDQARREFSAFLDQVEHHGEHIEIMRHYKAAAILVPPEWYEQAKAALAREEQER